MRFLVFTLSLLAFLSQTRATDYTGDLVNPPKGEVTLSYIIPVSIEIKNVSQDTVNLAAENEFDRTITCSVKSNAPYATLKITSENNFVLKNVIVSTVNSNDEEHIAEDCLAYEVNATLNDTNMDTDADLIHADVHAFKYGAQNVKLIFKLKDGEKEKDVVGGEYRDVLRITVEAQSEAFDASSHSSTESPMSNI